MHCVASNYRQYMFGDCSQWQHEFDKGQLDKCICNIVVATYFIDIRPKHNCRQLIPQYRMLDRIRLKNCHKLQCNTAIIQKHCATSPQQMQMSVIKHQVVRIRE